MSTTWKDNMTLRVIADVQRERDAQKDVHGWTPEHDAQHKFGELSRGALNYVAAATITMALGGKGYDAETPPPLNGMSGALEWPFERRYWKPGRVRRMLIKAAAMIVAEIERLDIEALERDGPKLNKGDQA